MQPGKERGDERRGKKRGEERSRRGGEEKGFLKPASHYIKIIFFFFFRCKTDFGMTHIISGNFDHVHPAETTKNIQRQRLKQAVKRKATKDLCTKPSKIISREILLSEDRCTDLEPNDYKAVRQALYRERAKLRPKLPESRKDTFEKLEEYLSKQSYLDMIHHIDYEAEMILFFNISSLELLCEPGNDVFGDGTFQFCAKHFSQLYTLHVHKNGHYIPCVYILLESKTQAAYRNMLLTLCHICESKWTVPESHSIPRRL